MARPSCCTLESGSRPLQSAEASQGHGLIRIHAYALRSWRSTAYRDRTANTHAQGPCANPETALTALIGTSSMSARQYQFAPRLLATDNNSYGPGRGSQSAGGGVNVHARPARVMAVGRRGGGEAAMWPGGQAARP